MSLFSIKEEKFKSKSIKIMLTSLVDGTAGPHYELDFELLGNGPPYILSTNVFADDDGHREQQFKFWFDPTSDFHEYKITWNQYQIVFFVDEIPIRLFKNHQEIGVKYPTVPMHVYSSLWNDTAWLGDVNWSLGPFYANFRGFTIDDCGNNNANCESQLNPQQQKMYQEIRRSAMVSNYCTRPGNHFLECKYDGDI
ncbi:hypothetical protein C2S52_006815 [Perilla frutescens var. hirtella]|nr:hypothetical protein C2S52_006815 [Perilla frutescens var. hirtella]